MANIKFSQFTVGNTESDIDFVVGYKGANNIQISPANLLSATLAGYLPLTGGTMTGNIKYNSGVRAQFGSSSNAEILFNGSNLLMSTFTGDMLITNYADDKDIIFQSDDGSGGVTEYFKLDGGSSRVLFSKNQWLTDNVKILLGNNDDLKIYHNAVNSVIESDTGNLALINTADNKDILFQSDNGSGGTTTYLYLDGSAVQTIFSKEARFLDNISAQFGSGGELRLYHTGTGSVIQNSTGNLTIQQDQNDGDIIFRNDDGSVSYTHLTLPTKRIV